MLRLIYRELLVSGACMEDRTLWRTWTDPAAKTYKAIACELAG